MRPLLVVAIACACQPGSSSNRPAPRAPTPRASPAPSPRSDPGIAPAFTTGSRIAATPRGALVSDADTGAVYEVDATGRAIAHAPLGPGVGQLVYDPARDLAFVADRAGDRIAVLDSRLAVTARFATPAEPFGLALSPDRKTLYVTAVADRALVALDAQTGAERWRTPLEPNPRGVSVAPDGRLAIVGSLAAADLQVVELTGEHRVASIPLDPSCEHCEQAGAFTRGTGVVRYLDATRAVATFQRSIPSALAARHREVYGGGARPPVTQHVAFFTFSPTGAAESVAQLVEHQPRSLAFDAARDALYIAGLGSDTLMTLPGVSTGDPDALEAHAQSAVLRASARCGPDGMATRADGKLLIWCSFSRSLLVLDSARDELVEGPPVAPSASTAPEHAGLVLFFSTTSAINRDKALACASCHLDGLADGLSWKLGAQALQTPVLAGRMAGTAPYRWDGSAASLAESLASTVHRLGGQGLGPGQSDALSAYLLSLPRPRPPTRDAAQVARGRAVFAAAGCGDCHRGAALTDGEQHAFASALASADTPSLVGLWSSAPYYHDGSAASLSELLRGGGSVHGMFDPARVPATQVADLQAFLESL